MAFTENGSSYPITIDLGVARVNRGGRGMGNGGDGIMLEDVGGRRGEVVSI